MNEKRCPEPVKLIRLIRFVEWNHAADFIHAWNLAKETAKEITMQVYLNLHLLTSLDVAFIQITKQADLCRSLYN